MKKFFLFLSAFVCSAVSVLAQQMPPVPMDEAVRYGKLPNGLTYYIRHNEEPKNQANFYIAQKVGSVQENDDQRGLAHFLEHMAFNGSVTFPGDGQLIKACEKMGVKFGANLNAYTSTDETVYNIDNVPTTDPANLDTCLWILHDWSNGLLLTAEEIDKERGVIHEEWRMRSSGQMRIFNRQLPTLYPGSKYGERMPIGLMSVIDNFEPEFLRAYYRKWYRPDLQGIIVVGDVDVDVVEQKIKDIFGPIQMPENAAAYELYPVPDNDEPIFVVDKDKEVQVGIILGFFKTETLPMEMRGTFAKLAQDYANAMVSSVINERLSDMTQKADCPFIQANVDFGKFLVSKTADAMEFTIVPKPGQDAAAMQAVMQEIARAAKFGLTETEYIRAREEYLSQLEKAYNNREKTNSRVFVQSYVRHFLEGDAAPSIEMEYQTMQMLAQQLRVEMFNAALQQKDLSGKNLVVLGMYPDKEGAEVVSAEALQAAFVAGVTAPVEAFVDNVKNEPLVPVMPAPVKIAGEKEADFGYTCWTLKNGARVFFRQTDFNDSEVLMSANSWGGLSLISDKDILNASVMDDVMNSCGWGNFTVKELDKALAGKQASVSVGMTSASEELNGRSTPKDLRTLFELIYLKFQPLKDDPDAFRNLMDGLRLQLENAEKMPMKSFQDSIQATLYCGNPRHVNLKLADLSKIDYKECQRIYSERFQSAGDFDFYFTGAFDVDSLREYVEQYIAPLPAAKKREKYNKKYIVDIVPGERAVRYNRQMETPQAYTMQLWTGEKKYSAEDDAVIELLGSALDQMLLKTIREEGGMAYSVSVNAFLNPGVKDMYALQIVCPFTPAKVDSVLMLIGEGIDEVSMHGIQQKFVDDYKQYQLKQYEEQQRKNAYWNNLIIARNLWGYDKRSARKAAIEGVNSDKVKDFVNSVIFRDYNVVKVTMLPADLTETE